MCASVPSRFCASNRCCLNWVHSELWFCSVYVVRCRADVAQVALVLLERGAKVGALDRYVVACSADACRIDRSCALPGRVRVHCRDCFSMAMSRG
eukprot:678109-Pleurochrysis_carterae.AAC.2